MNAQSLLHVPDDATPPVLNREECRRVLTRILELCSAPHATARAGGSANGGNNYHRGDLYEVEDGSQVGVDLLVGFDGQMGMASTNLIDEASLRSLVKEAEDAARQRRGPAAPMRMIGPKTFKEPLQRWFPATTNLLDPNVRVAHCRAAIDAAEKAGLIAAGYIYTQNESSAIMDRAGLFAYSCNTRGGLSASARTKDGQGSGSMRADHLDWGRIDGPACIAHAVDIALRSAKPVALEPGRYTVILEPNAVAELMGMNFDAQSADAGLTSFSLMPRGRNKIGLKVLDERITVVSDPWDPDMPGLTFNGFGEELKKVVWIERGILRNLVYFPSYAREKGKETVLQPDTIKLYVDGPKQSLDEMIAGTKRGLWVNRVSNVGGQNPYTGLVTGTTRDGTFLIENGRITKAVKNFRFTESPFFIFNRLEAAGESEPADRNLMAPRMKVRDFDFTSLTDAI